MSERGKVAVPAHPWSHDGVSPPDAETLEAEPKPDSKELSEVQALDRELEARYRPHLSVDTSLTRPLVSFQANKNRAIYRWFKYKEAFSAGLVEHLLSRCRVASGVMLDPFAGSGTSLFAASTLGLSSEGIELLPIGQQIITAKQLIEQELSRSDVDLLADWAAKAPWKIAVSSREITELRITRGAYPPETLASLKKFLASIQDANPRVRRMLFFALLCIAESISFTRKDGQYLRWDYRSGRHQGKKLFDKGVIRSFDEAITAKLREIVGDLRALEAPNDLFARLKRSGPIRLRTGSSLAIMPGLPAGSYDCILTSPPYCNRYDYTRTYALELALLGVDEAGLIQLRQEMLSCTVENRAKDLLALNPKWSEAIAAAGRQPLLQAILRYLDSQKELDLLNNDGIPRMVRGYFYEMACIIQESARLLKPGAPLIMVNDNVRYSGASISVDLILSELAAQLGFGVERIWVLPNGKGNSSQQMGAHGRDPLRKCVYVWRKL